LSPYLRNAQFSNQLLHELATILRPDIILLRGQTLVEALWNGTSELSMNPLGLRFGHPLGQLIVNSSLTAWQGANSHETADKE